MTELTKQQRIEDVLQRAKHAFPVVSPGQLLQQLSEIRDLSRQLGEHPDAGAVERELADYATRKIPLAIALDKVGHFEGAAKTVAEIIRLALLALESEQ